MAPPAKPEDLESWPVEICSVTNLWAIQKDDICKSGGRLTSFRFPII